MSPPAEIVRVAMSSTSVLRRFPPLAPPAMMTLLPSFAHPGVFLRLVLSAGHLPDSLQPASFVGPAMAASNSWILSLQMVMKLVGVMGTAQKKSMSIGRAGPLKASRCQKVAGYVGFHPSRKNTPMCLRTATAPSDLCLVRFPILLSSQRWFLSRTRQEAVTSLCPLSALTLPPQMAITGLGTDVKNVACWSRATGRGGGEQPLVLG